MPENKPMTLDALRQEIKRDMEILRAEQVSSERKLSERVSRLETSDAIRSTTLGAMQETMAEMRDDIKTLLEKPAKRYESLGNEVIKWAILGLLTATSIFGG